MAGRRAIRHSRTWRPTIVVRSNDIPTERKPDQRTSSLGMELPQGIACVVQRHGQTYPATMYPWRNWQTPPPQKRPALTGCRFKSCRVHQFVEGASHNTNLLYLSAVFFLDSVFLRRRRPEMLTFLWVSKSSRSFICCRWCAVASTVSGLIPAGSFGIRGIREHRTPVCAMLASAPDFFFI